MEMIAETALPDTPGTRKRATRPAASAAAASSISGQGVAENGEFLAFRLGGEEYGIDILHVQEIRSYENPTRIANAPAFVKGVVNLRGAIVPIIDLRLKLGCESADYDARTVVVMLKVRGRVVGAVVDSVSGVLELGREHIQPAAWLNHSVDSSFFTGIAPVKSNSGSGGTESERTLILMDIEGLMSSAELGLING